MEVTMSLTAVHAVSTPRRRTRDVLQVIEALRRQNPRAGESRLAELLADELLDDRELLLDAGRHLVHKALSSNKPKSAAKVTAARRQRVARVEAEATAVAVIAAKVKAICMLDTLMPNGVAMRYNTGLQMGAYGEAYSAIAAKVGTAMVGEVMVEAEVRELLQAAAV
jgi:hypothetical protein